MRILLDTDAMSGILTRRGGPSLHDKVEAIPPALRHVSTISIGEILYGIERSGRHEHYRQRLDNELLPRLQIVSFDEEAARQYAVLRAALERVGLPLEEADLRIAAIALAHNLALITGNARHFLRIPGLRVYNWLEG